MAVPAVRKRRVRYADEQQYWVSPPPPKEPLLPPLSKQSSLTSRGSSKESSIPSTAGYAMSKTVVPPPKTVYAPLRNGGPPSLQESELTNIAQSPDESAATDVFCDICCFQDRCTHEEVWRRRREDAEERPPPSDLCRPPSRGTEVWD